MNTKMLYAYTNRQLGGFYRDIKMVVVTFVQRGGINFIYSCASAVFYQQTILV